MRVERRAFYDPEGIINRAYYILHERIDHVEYLIGCEGNAFDFTGNVEC